MSVKQIVVCDRCGKTLGYNNRNCLVMRKTAYTLVFKWRYKDRERDLCHECLAEFEEFIDSRRSE